MKDDACTLLSAALRSQQLSRETRNSTSDWGGGGVSFSLSSFITVPFTLLYVVEVVRLQYRDNGARVSRFSVSYRCGVQKKTRFISP